MAHDTLSFVRTEGLEGRTIVLLHGFTQNARCWGGFGAELTSLGSTLALDLPGHGGSSEIVSDLSQSAALIAAAIDSQDGHRPVCVIGYSLGGRTALHLALARPDLVGQLVLIGATGGIDDPDERHARRESDNALADRIIAIGVEAFVDEWLSQPMFATLSPEKSNREERIANSAEGLSSSLRHCGTGTQSPLWDKLHALEMPVLVLSGAEDLKFRELGERLCHAIGSNATSASIPSAGHSAHLEAPHDTFLTLASWLGAAPMTSASDEEPDRE